MSKVSTMKAVAILFFCGGNAEIFALSLFCNFEVIKFKDVAFLMYASVFMFYITFKVFVQT